MGGVLTSGSAVVSEPIYKFFQALYDEETKRFAELESRARLYFSIASLYVGAIAFKFDDVVKLVALPSTLIVIDGVLFVVSVLFCVLAMQLRKYEGIAEPYDILHSLQVESVPTDGFSILAGVAGQILMFVYVALRQIRG